VPQSRPYYAERGLSARYYDLVTANDGTLEGDVELYAGLAPPGGTVLELGAGTGRVAIALAERGLSVEGVDLAPAMLAQAEAKRASLPAPVAERIRFRMGDMAALALGRLFDVVICPFFGLAHLPAGSAWKNTFSVMARHLKPGGRCAVHLPLAELMAHPGPSDRTRPVLRLPTGEAGRTLELFVRERRFRPEVGRMDQVLDYVVSNPLGAVEARSFERQTFYAADPVPFAADAGLEPCGEPHRLGQVGDVYVFQRASAA
jgi:SAM-dependent methyltransferase